MIMNLRLFIVLCFFVLIAAGAIYLAVHKVPAPKHLIEKVISNDHFAK
jgi:hypothetical protein